MATLATILSAYETNADYREDADADKCAAFISACTKLLVKLPTRSSGGGAESEFNVELIEKQLDRAEKWLALHQSAGALVSDPQVIHPDFSGFRY